MRQTVRRRLQFAVCHMKGSAHGSHGCRRKVNKDGTERKVAAASDRKVGIEFYYAKNGTKTSVQGDDIALSVALLKPK